MRSIRWTAFLTISLVSAQLLQAQQWQYPVSGAATFAGKVGIGNTNPAKDLHISGATEREIFIETTTDGFANLTLQSNNKKWSWTKRPGSSGDVLNLFYHDGTQWVFPAAITVNPNGNSIFTPATEYGYIGIQSPSSTGGSVLIDFTDHLDKGNSAYAYLGLSNHTSWSAPINSLSLVSTRNGTKSTKDIMMWANDAPNASNVAFAIKANTGNIGVGTASPTEKLDVNGSGKFNGGGGGAFSIGPVNGSYRIQTNVSGPGIRFLNPGNSYAAVAVGRLSIGASYASEIAPVSGVLIEGSVGIGTTDTKTYKLAVNGDAMFTKVKVMPYGNWPDYVFGEGYHLRPLSEVEQFIKANKHLPEVPSSVEVEKEGIDVGDNQALLLKKIEELTLYVIDQNKKLEQQALKLKEQEQKVAALMKLVEHGK